MAGGVANPTYKKLPYGGRDAYRSFAAFYPFYLGEHSDPACRRLHVAGTSASLALAAAAALTLRPALALAVPVVGYGLAWVSLEGAPLPTALQARPASAPFAVVLGLHMWGLLRRAAVPCPTAPDPLPCAPCCAGGPLCV